MISHDRSEMLQKDILQHALLLLELGVVLTVDVGEAPLARDDDLLATGELGCVRGCLHVCVE